MKLSYKFDFGAIWLQGLPVMLPELTLSALPRHIWFGMKSMAAIAALYTLAAPSPWAGFDREGMAQLASKKTIDFDPIMTGSVPKSTPKVVKKTIKV